MEEKLKHKRIAIIDHTESRDGRVDALFDYFKNRGAEVNVITSNFSHYTKVFINTKRINYIYLPVVPYKKNISLKRIISHIGFARKVKDKLNEENYDLVWALIPPNYLLKEIVKSKKKTNFKLIADIEDLWPESLPVKNSKLSFPFKLWRNLRDKNLDKADKIVTECDLYRKYLPKKVLSKTTTLHLAMSKANFINNSLSNKSYIKIVYLGSINNIINIDLICKVVNMFTKFSKVEFRIIGDGENRKKLIYALQKNKKIIVKFYGKIFDEQKKKQLISECNFGINLMQPNIVVGLTMKSMDYLKNGVPLINNIKGDTHELVDKYKIGLNVPFNSDEIASILPKTYDKNFRNRIIDLYNKNFSLEIFDKKITKLLMDLFKQI